MLMMMSKSSSIAATKSITVRLSNSRSPAKVVSVTISTFFLLNGSISARIRLSTSARSIEFPYRRHASVACPPSRRKSGPVSGLSSGGRDGKPCCDRTGEGSNGRSGTTRRDGLLGPSDSRATHGAEQHAPAFADGRPEGLDPDGRDLPRVLDRRRPLPRRRLALAARDSRGVRVPQLAVRGHGHHALD